MKYFTAVLLGEGIDMEGMIVPELEAVFGAVDHRGTAHPFDRTDYYEDEMGPGLRRMIISFEPLRPPTDLIRAKLDAYGIERRLGNGGMRRVNIDPGCMDYFKVVLASFKEGPQKIYLGSGVYADTVLMFHDGAYGPLPWSFPDFRDGTYSEDFSVIRKLYSEALRRRSPGGGRAV